MDNTFDSPTAATVHIVGGHVDQDMTWGPLGSLTHYSLDGHLYVDAGSTLTLGAGATLQDDFHEMIYVDGRLEGTGATVELQYYYNSSNISKLFVRTGGVVDLAAGTVSGPGYIEVQDGGQADFTNMTFAYGDWGSSRRGDPRLIYEAGSAGSLLGCTMSGYLRVYSGSSPTVNGSTFTSTLPVYCPAEFWPELVDNTFDSPTAATVHIVGGHVDQDMTWGPLGSLTYHNLDGHLYVDAGATLTLGAGATLQDDYPYMIYVDGRLEGSGATVELQYYYNSSNLSKLLVRDGGVVDLAAGTVAGPGYIEVEGGGRAEFTNITFAYGSAIRSDGTVTLTNSTVSGSSRGGIYSSGTATLTNSTVSGNSHYGIYNSGKLTLNNTIVALNAAPTHTDIRNEGAGSITNNNSLVGVDPSFVRNPWTMGPHDCGDLRLLPISPAIDAGDDALLPTDEFDLDGDGNVAEPLPVDLAGGRRVLGPRVDIGAYEGAVVVIEIYGDSVDPLMTGDAMALGEGARLELVIGGGGNEFVSGTYTLIEAAGGLTGTFDVVADLGAYVSVNGNGLTYNEAAGTVTLTLDRNLNPGDANLDCATDVLDRIIWNTNNFTSGTTFITGDFDGDGVTDVLDRIIWSTNNFTVATAAPAPQAAAPGAMAAVFPDDAEDVPAAAGVSSAPTAEQMPVVQSTLADAAGPFGMGVAVGGAAYEASSETRTDGTGRRVTVDNVTVSAAQLEVDVGVGLASPV